MNTHGWFNHVNAQRHLTLVLIAIVLAADGGPATALECDYVGTAPATDPNDAGFGTAVACGDGAVVAATNGIALGSAAVVGFNALSGIAIGEDATVTGSSEAPDAAQRGIAIGDSANSTGTNGIALGNSAQAATSAIAFGRGALANGISGVALGFDALASGDSAISLGSFSHAGGQYNIAIGNGATVGPQYSNAIALGRSAQANRSNAMVLGSIPFVNSATAYVDVGIGTTMPGEAVDVERAGTAARFQLTSITNDPVQAPQYIQRRARGASGGLTTVQNNDNLGLFSFRGYNGTTMGGSRATITAQAAGTFTNSSTPTRLIFATTPVGKTVPEQVLVITPDGKVQVNGQNLNVPDYVFGKGYELMPMGELRTFINKHGHLPGIASAEEVKTTGLDLAGAHMGQLRMIEELTLYTLQLHDRAGRQSDRIHALEAKNQELEQQLEEMKALAMEIAALKAMMEGADAVEFQLAMD